METLAVRAERTVEPDGATVEVYPLPTDAASLEELLTDIFQNSWQDITFGPIIQGAAWEIKAPCAPTTIGVLDGYITIAFGATHFHLCIGLTKGTKRAPTSEALAKHRRTSRAELYRRFNRSGEPNSWGLRLFNGQGEQQATILLPNPFLAPATDKVLKAPDWSRLALWDHLRAKWLGLTEPDPIDRLGRGFRHD